MLRRFKGVTHKILDIFRLNPRRADAHLDFRSVQFLWLHLHERLHVYGIFRVVLRIDLCRFQFVAHVAAQILVGGFPPVRNGILEDNTCQFLPDCIGVLS